MDKELLLAIEKPRARCGKCDAPIDELERHPSGLRLAEEAPPVRADYCPECWRALKDETWDSYWITRREPKDKRMPKLTRRQKAAAARILFEALWEQRDREDMESHLFMLAHLMLKWGGLKWRKNSASPEGREIIVFENPATGDPVEIPSVTMTEERAEEIKAKIEGFLRENAPEGVVSL